MMTTSIATTLLPVMQLRAPWKINNLSMYQLGTWITSPEFTFDSPSEPDDVKGTRKWRMRIRLGNPDVKSGVARENVQLRIGVQTGEPFDTTFCAFLADETFRLRDTYVCKFPPIENMPNTKNYINEVDGYWEFMWTAWSSMTELLRQAYLEDDSVTIVCMIKKIAVKIEAAPIAPIVAKIHPSPADESNYQLEQIRSTGFLSDVIIQAHNHETLPCHAVILAARSPVFKAMFTHKMKESQERIVEILDVHIDVLQAFIQFLYLGSVRSQNWLTRTVPIVLSKAVIDSNTKSLDDSEEKKTDGKDESQDTQPFMTALLSVAHRYDCLSLLDFCTRIFVQHSSSILTLENVAAFLSVASQLNLSHIQEVCVQYLNPTNLTKFMESPFWTKLSPEVYRRLMMSINKRKSVESSDESSDESRFKRAKIV